MNPQTPTAQTGLALPEKLRYVIEPDGNPAGKITSDSPGQFEDLESAKAIAAELVRRYNAHTEIMNALQNIVSIWESEERNESVTLNRYIREAKKLLAKSTGQTQV